MGRCDVAWTCHNLGGLPTGPYGETAEDGEKKISNRQVVGWVAQAERWT